MATEFKRGKYKVKVRVGDWFKPIVPLFLTCLLRKLQFLIPIVDFGPPEILAKLRLSVRKKTHTHKSQN